MTDHTDNLPPLPNPSGVFDENLLVFSAQEARRIQREAFEAGKRAALSAPAPDTQAAAQVGRDEANVPVMLEHLIYAAILHDGRPKTPDDFCRSAAHVLDMLVRGNYLARPAQAAEPVAPRPTQDSGMTVIDLRDDDALRFACRVLGNADAPAPDRLDAKRLLMAIRTRVRAKPEGGE